MPPVLRTDRIELGAWQDGDLAAYEAMTLERDRRAAAAPPPEGFSQEVLRSAVERAQHALARTGIMLYALRIEGSFAGYCGLVLGRSTLAEPEIAYELPQRFHGRGYATEAGHAVVTAAASTGRARVWATVRRWNEPSLGVLRKLGFTLSDRVSTDDFGDLNWWSRSLGRD